MSNINICSYNERDNYRSQNITHLITIANPGADNDAPAWFTGDHLPLWFGDVVSEADARQCNTKAASSDDIKQAIIFFRVARQQPDYNILISCDYGASRSPALAYVLLADQYGQGRESEALNEVLYIRPESVPNKLVVQLADQLLARQGQLILPLEEFSKAIYKEAIGMPV
jgi:predicted protein tyrosine phosphatase